MRTKNNTIFNRIKKDFSSIWFMLSNPVVDDSESNLDSYTPTSIEDEKIVEELRKSEIKLDDYANEYLNSIGLSNKSKKKNTSRTSRNINPILNINQEKKFNLNNDKDLER